MGVVAALSVDIDVSLVPLAYILEIWVVRLIRFILYAAMTRL